MRKLSIYKTPPDFLCPACNQPCRIVALDNSFSYSGTHCTHGQSGIHYPFDYGNPVTDCCEADVSDAELDEPDYDY
jgi:hypothetical protein